MRNVAGRKARTVQYSLIERRIAMKATVFAVLLLIAGICLFDFGSSAGARIDGATGERLVGGTTCCGKGSPVSGDACTKFVDACVNLPPCLGLCYYGSSAGSNQYCQGDEGQCHSGYESEGCGRSYTAQCSTPSCYCTKEQCTLAGYLGRDTAG